MVGAVCGSGTESGSPRRCYCCTGAKITLNKFSQGILAPVQNSATKRIRFKPAVKDGKTVSVRGQSEFTFTL